MSAGRINRAPAGTGLSALRLTGIWKRFGRVIANQDVSFDVHRGEIHALLGENGAGKTTLMNIAFGLLTPDAGSIEVAGMPARISSPRTASRLGIGMVHQHFKLVPDMTVSENVALARGSSGLTPLRLAKVRARLAAMSRSFDLHVDPDARIEALSVGEQQRVEILKRLFGDASVLILDEPTAVLTPGESQQLAAVMRQLAADGRALILISHKLDEVIRIADRCTVLRKGRVVGVRSAAGVSKRELARMMVGRDVRLRVARGRRSSDTAMLELRRVGAAERGRRLLRDIDLTVAKGEIVGVAGVDGNGQRELVEAIIGARPYTGEITLDGRRLIHHSPADFTAAGGAVVPADRDRSGLAEDLSVTDNLLLKDYACPPFARRGLMHRREMRAHAARLASEFGIRVADVDAPVRELSGGNRQKVVLARELARRPRLLIAAQPTRGLDVGAAESIHKRLIRYTREGGALLLVSTDLDEILSFADRSVAMVGGRLSRAVAAEDFGTAELGMLIGGEPFDPAEAMRA